MRALLAVPAAILAAAPARAAEPACTAPFSEVDFRELVERAKAAIQQGDVSAHRAVLDELERRIPCMDGQLPSRLWAEFLVTEALIRYADEAPGWQSPLKLAMDLAPDIAVPPHLTRDYFPPADPPGVPVEVPKGQVVVLDGRIATGFIPPLAGMHVAQTVLDGRWRSRLLRGERFPPEWLGGAAPPEREDPPPPPPPSPGLASWGAAGVHGGFGAWSQSGREGADVPEQSNPGTWLGASTCGAQGLSRGLGVFWSAAGGVQDSPGAEGGASPRRRVPLGAAYAGLSVFDEPLSLWVGGGASLLRLVEAPEGDAPPEDRLLPVPHYLVGVSYRSAGGLPLDVSAGGGWGPWATHARAHAGAIVLDGGGVGLRVGAEGAFTRATLVDRAAEGSPVVGAASSWSGGLTLGLGWR